MGQIIIDNDEKGEDKFFNLSVKLFLQNSVNSKTSSISNFKQCFNSSNVKMYLASLHDDYCEILAFNKDNKERYFKLNIDSNLKINGIEQIKIKEDLSDEAKNFLNFHNSNDQLMTPGKSN